MISVHTILVAIDFGPASGRLLEFGRVLADACGASLHLLHVIPFPLAHPETVRQEQDDARQRLEALLEPADRERRRAAAACHVGTPAHEIAAYAAAHDIDLIVMGTHAHGETFRMARGSIAETVTGLVPCAVLTVKSAEPPAHAVTAATQQRALVRA